MVLQKLVADSITGQLNADNAIISPWGEVPSLFADAIPTFTPKIIAKTFQYSSCFRFTLNMPVNELKMSFNSCVLFAKNALYRGYIAKSSTYVAGGTWEDLTTQCPWLRPDHTALSVHNVTVLVCARHLILHVVFRFKIFKRDCVFINRVV